MISTKSWWKFEADEEKHWDDVWKDHWKGKNLSDLLSSTQSCPEASIVFRAIDSAERVLEAGCGFGQWVIAASQRGALAVGIDLHRGPMSVTHDAHPSLPLIQADLVAVPFSDGEFDVILSFGVVEHFEAGFEPLLAEKSRTLQDDGTLIISVPYYNLARRVLEPFICLRRALVSHPRIRSAFGKAPYSPRRFYQYAYTGRRFRRLLRECGFESCEMLVYETEFGLTRDYPTMRALRRRSPRTFRALLSFLTWISPRTVGHMQLHRARKIASR